MTILLKYIPRLPRGCALTNRNSLITVGPSPPVSTAAAVITTEVSVTLTCAVEETDWPSFPVVPSVVGVLRAVRARIHRDGHALSAPHASTTRVVVQARGWRTALSTSQSLGCHTFSGELSTHDRRAQKNQKAALPHYPKRLSNFTHDWDSTTGYLPAIIHLN